MKNWSHPLEVRQRAVAAIERGENTVAEVARIFGVAERALYAWRRRLRETGTPAALPHRSGNPPRLDEEGLQLVREMIASEPDVTLEELVRYFGERTHKSCSRSAMGRAVVKLGLTRKKRR